MSDHSFIEIRPQFIGPSHVRVWHFSDLRAALGEVCSSG
jgi:hypothetical protein